LLLVFAIIVGLALSTTVALPLGHAASPSSAGPSAAASHAARAATTSPAGGKKAPAASLPPNAYVRVLQAVPNLKPIDIYVNGTLTVSNLAYKSNTSYWPLLPGVWGFTVYPTGAMPISANLEYSVSQTFASNIYYTLALIGNNTTGATEPVTSTLFADSNAAPTAGDFNARFFQAAPSEGPVTVSALNNITGKLIWGLPSTAYKGLTSYVSEANATLNITANLTATPTKSLVYTANTALAAADYTIVLVGFDTVAAPLKVLFLMDASYSGTPVPDHKVVLSTVSLTALSAFTTLPVPFVFSITATNASIAPTDQLYLNITDFKTSALCTSIDLNTSILPVMASKVYYTSRPNWGTVSSETWGLTLTAAMLVNTTSCPNFGIDPEIISVAGSVTDAINGTASAAETQQTAFVYTPVTSALHVSSTPSAPTTFSIYANYTAQYVGRVQLSIYNPVNGLVTYSSNLIWTAGKATTVTWLETVAGNYPYTLSVYTAVGVFNTTGFIGVLPTGSTFYNSTTWVNSTLVSGLSSSAAGTILLIVGLLIGMLVAMVVGRMVWGGPKTVPPAQPWAQKPGTTGANTCSVCGQSFGTPEELAAHSKSEHGMQ